MTQSRDTCLPTAGDPRTAAVSGGISRAHDLHASARVHNLSTATPRISATADLSRNCSRAAIVAFTTLCGLCVPIDLVSTLGTPAAVITARTGPPAITP